MRYLITLLFLATMSFSAFAADDDTSIPVNIEWQSLAWGGVLWDKDVSENIPVNQNDDGYDAHNSYARPENIRFVMSNLDLRNGPVTFEIKSALPIAIGVCSQSRGKGNEEFFIDQAKDWTMVRMAFDKSKFTADVAGAPAVIKTSRTETDVFVPMIDARKDARFAIRNVRQEMNSGGPIVWLFRSRTSKEDGHFARDVAASFTAVEKPENTWLLSNNHHEHEVSLALLANYDVRNGPIEFEVKTQAGPCDVGIASVKDAYERRYSSIGNSSAWAVVRMGFENGIATLRVDGKPVELRRRNNTMDLYRPYFGLKPGEKIELRNIRQLPRAPLEVNQSGIAMPDGSAARNVAISWRIRGWDGKAQLWSRDISKYVWGRKQADGSWRITNNYRRSERCLVAIQGVDLRDGPIEMEIMTEGTDTHVGAYSFSGDSAYRHIYIDEPGRWHKVRFSVTDKEGWVNGWPVPIHWHHLAQEDVFQFGFQIFTGTSVKVRSIVQYRR